MTQKLVETDGRHDFDFALGRRRLHIRKLANTLDRECTEWVEFEGIGEMRPILGGLGNFDTIVPIGLPHGQHFEAATVRLFEPSSGLWRIWWLSTWAPGAMDESPAEGRFTNGRGQFFSDEVIGGEKVRLRLEWFEVEPGAARSEQAFSWDGGETFQVNFIMTGTLEDES